MTNEISIISLYRCLKLGWFDLQLVHVTIFVLFFNFLLSNEQDVIVGALLILELGLKFASEKGWPKLGTLLISIDANYWSILSTIKRHRYEKGLVFLVGVNYLRGKALMMGIS